MKKLIAITVVFALFSGAAFADTSISGTISVRAKLLDVELNENDQIVNASGQVETTYVELSGQNDEGTFGGLVRMRGNDGAGKFHRAFTWWKPIPQLEVFLGQDLDGKFAFYNPWSHFNGQEGYHHKADWGRWRAAMAFTNWDTFGLAFSLFPVDGLEVNLVVPFGGIANLNPLTNDDQTGWQSAFGFGNGNLYVNPTNYGEGTYPGDSAARNLYGGSLQLTVSYAIPDIGKVYFGLSGAGRNNNRELVPSIFLDDYKPVDYGVIGLAFNLTAIEGLDVLIGGSSAIPGENVKVPFLLALMANYGAGDFGVKTRWRLHLNASDQGYNFHHAYAKDSMVFGFDVMPYYNLGILSAYLNIGMIAVKGATGDPKIEFSINPYIRKSVGPGSIRIGLLFDDPDMKTDNDATLSVPVTFGYSF